MTSCADADTLPEINITMEEFAALVERQVAMMERHVQFLEDSQASGQFDRVVLRELLATYEQLRHDFLVAYGMDPNDPATAELMPFPVPLLSS